MVDDDYDEVERRCSERAERFLAQIADDDDDIGYDDLVSLRQARTYKLTRVEPNPEYL